MHLKWDGFPAHTMGAVICSLCGRHKARRACPALGHQICAVCCGTKRLVEIACPAECPYLAIARDHPPAAAVRQQQNDLEALVRFMRDLSDRQSRLFFLILTFLARFRSTELQPLIDDDVVEALSSLAGTYEAATSGLIYEPRPSSVPAERLAGELKPVLAEVGKGGGSAFERDGAIVLRRVEAAARHQAATAGDNRRSFLDLLGRVIRQQRDDDRPTDSPAEAPRVIIP